MPAVLSRASSAFIFTLAVLVAIVACLASAMPTASKLKLAAKKTEIKIDTSLPPVINWLEKGVLGAAFNEGQCGDSNIFARVGNIEAANNIANPGRFVGISTQQFTTCLPNGCNGMPLGEIEKYLRSVNGNVASNTTVINSNFCATAKNMQNPGARVTAFKSILGEETAMHAELVKGPFVVTVDAASWETYTNGVLDNCPASQIDDTALVVGVNVATSVPYWILRPSWGNFFGQAGAIYIKYGSNQCGITSDPTSVDVAQN